MTKSFQLTERTIDVNDMFEEYKFAIPEHNPIKLSNGLWLHTYRLTPYSKEEYFDNLAYGDQENDYND